MKLLKSASQCSFCYFTPLFICKMVPVIFNTVREGYGRLQKNGTLLCSARVLLRKFHPFSAVNENNTKLFVKFFTSECSLTLIEICNAKVCLYIFIKG